MRKRMILWIFLFAAGLLTVLFRTDISRYASDLTALLAFGSLLAAAAGAGLLLEAYKREK